MFGHYKETFKISLKNKPGSRHINDYISIGNGERVAITFSESRGCPKGQSSWPFFHQI